MRKNLMLVVLCCLIALGAIAADNLFCSAKEPDAIEQAEEEEPEQTKKAVALAVEPPAEKAEEPEEPELIPLGEYFVTGYAPYCSHCCRRADGITASGKVATIGVTAAVGDMPFGTELYIEGYGFVTVEDRGVEGKHIDIALEDHEACYAVTGTYRVFMKGGAA